MLRIRLSLRRKDAREQIFCRGRGARTSAALFVAVVPVFLLVSGCASADKKPMLDPEAELAWADELIARKKYYKARLKLQEVLQFGITDKEQNSRAQIALADSYYRDGGTLNLAEALARYTNFLAFNPLHTRSDYVQYQVGLCYFEQVYSSDKDQGQTRKSMEEFRKVRALYPASPFVAEAEARMQEGRQLLAHHELVVGRFYASRKAYMAAIDRYRSILDRFPRFNDKPTVYFLLAKALNALERFGEARAYLKLLIANYPDHEIRSSAEQMLRKLDRRSLQPVGVADVIEE